MTDDHLFLLTYLFNEPNIYFQMILIISPTVPTGSLLFLPTTIYRTRHTVLFAFRTDAFSTHSRPTLK
jgi:hypothetical protein